MGRIRIMKKNRMFFFFVSVLVIAFIPFFFDVYFTTSDDPRFIALVSGAYTGIPVKELIYEGVILGFLETKLYSFAPDFEWYSIVYYLCTLFAFVAILWQVLICDFSKWKRIAVVSLVLITQIYLSFKPQFTTLATQLSFASIILGISPNGGYKKNWLSILLFFIATQFRLAAALLPYMIAWPLFLKDMNLRSSMWWKEKIWLIGIILVVLVSYGADKYTYRSEEWKTFNDINDARGYMADNPMASCL